VDDAYNTVENDSNDRNGGATMKKKMYKTTAAMNAPNSGRANTRVRNDGDARRATTGFAAESGDGAGDFRD